MTTSDAVRQERKERLQDFIFERELAEVYLLLDHISGHSEKTLENADGEAKDFIQEIAEIYWPPKNKEQPVEVAAQAATILRVKDRLTAAAKPANGASIAFTLLVTGDDAIDEPKQARGSGHWLRRLWHRVGQDGFRRRMRADPYPHQLTMVRRTLPQLAARPVSRLSR